MGEDIGIDLGTTTILINIKGKGIVLREPSVVAVNKETNEIIAIGEKAFNMLGRVPSSIEIVKPLKDGVISNFTLTGKMIKYYIKKVCKNKLFAPRIMICIPSQITEVEKRAVIDVATEAGAKKVYLIEEPVAAAIGAGIEIQKPYGNLVVDIGGGTTDIAVISIGNSVISTSINTAGNKFDETIMKFIKMKYKMLIGERTAENIKMNIGCVFPRVEDKEMIIRGINLQTGLPMQMNLNSRDILQPLQNDAMKIVDGIIEALEKTPSELVEDISNRGIYLTGGGSLIYGMDKLIQQKTKIKVMVADDAISCVAIGTGKALNNLNLLDKKNIK